jgi:hypothetical protein
MLHIARSVSGRGYRRGRCDQRVSEREHDFRTVGVDRGRKSLIELKMRGDWRANESGRSRAAEGKCECLGAKADRGGRE